MTRTDPWTDPRAISRAGLSMGQTVPVTRGGIRRWAPPVATTFAVVAVISFPLSLWLYYSNRAHVPGVSYAYGDYTAGLLYPVLGAYLLYRRPDNRVGWVFAATSIVGVNGLAGQYAVAARFVHPGWPLGDLAAWINAWAWGPELIVPALLPLLFPDGTLSSRRWRPVAITALGALVVTLAILAAGSHVIDASDRITNPWGITGAPWLRGLSMVGIFTLFLCAVLALVCLVLRTRSARGTARARLQWLMFSVLVTVALGAAAMATRATVSEILWSLAMAAIPAGVLVAVTRHRMLDIEIVLNRTIVYGLLTGAVVIAYVVTVSSFGEVAAKRIGIAAVALVALLLAAARTAVQRVVDRALFGERRDPYAVVSRLGQRVDAAQGPLDALGQLAGELRAALRLPYVAVLPDADQLPPVETGTVVAGTTSVPITVHGDRVGTLQVGRRHHGERLRPQEESVLHDTARRAGALIQAAVLIADLHSSRERIVAAREEERRRLRHDLHDGVGPQLAGLALQLDSLARRLAEDPANAARVHQLRDRLRDTVGEVRRVVDNLRPPALDDVGLVEAVRQHVSAYAVVGAGSGASPLVGVNAAELPRLPAAVEVAAYRIITESVANAVRHARPSRCNVTLTAADSTLSITITDDGSGIAPGATPGVGLASMRERAAEVGGTLDVTTATTGTTVSAQLPLELT